MPDFSVANDKDNLSTLIEKIGAEPKEAEFDDEGNLVLLNLAGLNIKSLPSEIGQFFQLQKLVLGETVLEEGSELQLGNQITYLPPEIGQLTNLRSLDVRHNELTSLPSEIGQLSKLKRLDLWNNKLTTLPPEIGQLANLQSLDLWNNELTNLPSEIGCLTKLIFLGLSRNCLFALPPEIGRLANLQELYLRNNSLTEFIVELTKLTGLTQILHLGDNKIKRIPPEIARLTNIRELRLWGNELTSLPDEITQLTDLQNLYLQKNQLTILPSKINNLTKLSILSLEHNRLTELPFEILQLDNLQHLNLNGNPLRIPPPEIAERGIDDTLDYLRDLAKGSVTRYETKLLIIGEGGSGKSSLLRALQRKPFDPNLSTTHGINIEPLNLTHSRQPEVEITLNIWDFGGQQIYHTTHQFFLTQRSLYVLVWNARVDADQGRLDHWLRNIQVLAPDAPIMIVATHIDERPADFNYDRYKTTYPQLVGHIGVSNKNGEGINELKQLLAEEATKLPLMEQEWPQTWVAAEAALLKNSDRHINLAGYSESCVKHGLAAEIASTAFGGYLHDLGKILYYQDDHTLSDFVVLKPNWLTRAISRVLDDDNVRKNGGIINHADFGRIWDVDENGEPYERRLYPLFLRLMERFLISFQLESKEAGKPATQSLVPLLLAHTPPPNMPVWENVLHDQPEIRMVFRLVNFVPPGIMSWFITLTHLYSQGLHWREGVRLQYEGHQAQVELNPSQRELWLYVRGPAPSNFFNILQHTINDRILKYYFEGLTYKREVPCHCHVYRDEPEPCPYFHDYERLAKRMKRGKLTTECGESFDEVSVPELLEGIHYTTNNRVIAKLEEGFQQLADGQGRIIEISSANQELLLQNRQLYEQLNRSFTRLWNLQMASLNAECPNAFLLMPGDRRAFSPKNLFDTEYTLYLMCQHPPQPHIVSGGKGIPLRQSKEWWLTLAPWLKRLMEYLRYIPKGRAIATAYDEGIFQDFETSMKVFDAIIKAMPEVKTHRTVEQVQSLDDRFSYQEVEGPSLRALHSFLKEKDDKQNWCGLHRTPTNDGNIFWLCDEHRKTYQPK
ncbi:MAG: GTPase [Chloroflexi bacterium]|nr:GTPase [Chloroflexota bacterium]